MRLESIESFVKPDSTLARLSAEERALLFEVCLKYITSFHLQTKPTAEGQKSVARVGGDPLGFTESWPVDKNGMALQFILSLPIESSDWKQKKQLYLFFSPRFQSFNAKERSWFYIYSKNITDEDPRLSGVALDYQRTFINPFPDTGKLADLPTLVPELTDGLSKDLSATIMEELAAIFQRYSGQANIPLERLRLARTMASFYANGISYSPERACDSHFSHLVEEAKNWFVLFHSGENSILNLSDNLDILFCIRYDDFRNGDLFKGRPIVIPA